MEEKYFYERHRIEKLGIKEIKESVFQQFKEDCSRDLAELRYVYSFDKRGNLVRVDEYLDGKDLKKSIAYERGQNGRFTSKTYIFHDRLTLSKTLRKWEFEFDTEGRPVVERLKYDGGYTLTNILTYDQHGNYSSQIRDGSWEWHFTYNKNNSIIASKEGYKRHDSLVWLKIKRYKYKDGFLLNEELIIPNRPDSVWSVLTYTYNDQERLVQITDSRHQASLSPYTHFKYDDKGNCIEKSLSREGEKPFRCYYYSYTYH